MPRDDQRDFVPLSWTLDRPGGRPAQVPVDPQNTSARRLYASAGFVELEEQVDGEVVAELTALTT